MNVLFVCSRNQWRSPTAEAVYKDEPGLSVRSAGTAPSARVRLSVKSLAWADLIFVMEKRHRQRIVDRFGAEAIGGKVVVLDIADDYKYMDPELIEEIRAKVDLYLSLGKGN